MKIYLVLLLTIVVLLAGCKDDDKPQQPEYSCPDTHVKTTSPGICLPKRYPVNELSQIDRTDGGYILMERGSSDAVLKKKINDVAINGLQEMIAAALLHNPSWTRFTTTGGYEIVMIHKMATNMDGTPALLVRGTQSAGTVINVYADLNERGTPIIVLPLPDPDGFNDAYWAYLKNSCWNEGEHVIEWLNDKAIFRQKAIEGDMHPHWPPAGSLLPSEPGLVDRILLGESNIEPVVLPIKK